MPTLTQKPFNSYRIEYGITNPSGKDLVRIDFLLGETKVGQPYLVTPSLQERSRP